VRTRFTTSVLALHDVDLARAFATRLIGLKGGLVVFDAWPERVAPGEVEALYAP
jgi:phosphonate transport system ATP-binding protein